MKRICYGAPPSNTPAGGVKVIYKNSEKINLIGGQSAVWHPSADEFKCNWFDHKAKIITMSDLNAAEDFIVIPEIWASAYAEKLISDKFKYGIYVQNCYYTHVNLDVKNINAIQEAYDNAEIVLSISKDTSVYLENIFNIKKDKIILQRYAINEEIFKPNYKSKIITYMPRKMQQHSNRVMSILNKKIPKDWQIVPIDNMPEKMVAEILSKSIIFLAFSEFEGLPVPPVEAALSGNIVIGYHGEGGREYWNEPNFQLVEQGNIQKFIEITMNKIKEIDQNKIDISEINNGISYLRKYFSAEVENQFLRNLLNRVNKIS